MLTSEEARLLERARDLEETLAGPGGPERRERLTDLLSTERLRAAYGSARAAPSGRDGEAARRELRLLVPPFLLLAREPRPGPIGGLGENAAIASYSEDPEQRREATEALRREADRREDDERSAREAAERASTRAGASGIPELLASTVPDDCRDFADRTGRSVLAPLDDAIERGAAERWLRSPWTRGASGTASSADVPFLERLGDRSAAISTRAVRDAVRGVAVALGQDPSGRGPVLESPREGWRLASAVEPWGHQAHVTLASHGGPGALREAFGALGLALRHEARRRTKAAPGSDPAFRWAASELFARIATRRRGLERWLPPMSAEVLLDLRFESALVPRVAWALSVDDPAALVRATARPPSPARILPLDPVPVEPSARLRGAVLAVLLEEHFLMRFGYAWWESREAASLLTELWETEAQETPASVASTLGLGTIEPSPLVDAYRP